MAWAHAAPVPGRSVSGDLRDRDSVIAELTRLRPSLVIHAAMALDAVSIVEATANVVEGASRVGAHLVHLSTDAVFSGDGRPRDEDALPDPISPYGRWKAEAEDVVLHGDAAVVRLPLVVSLDPEDGAVARIRRHAPTHWFHDEMRQPAMAADLAPAIWQIARLPDDRRTGVWHLPGPERLSRYEIAQRVVEALGLDPTSIVSAATPPDVVRPKDLVLGADRARGMTGWNPAPILR